MGLVDGFLFGVFLRFIVAILIIVVPGDTIGNKHKGDWAQNNQQ